MHFITASRHTDLSYDVAAFHARVSYSMGEEISDEVAMTIASAWSSPGTVGKWLAMLSTTGTAPAPYLIDDINATRGEEGMSHADRRLLDQLATWVHNHESIAEAKAYRGYVHCECCGMDTMSLGVLSVSLCTYCEDDCCEPTLIRTPEGFQLVSDSGCPVMAEEAQERFANSYVGEDF